MAHAWKKGRWYVYGSYVHRDDKCSCGCIKRVFINESGKEESESYTVNDDVTTLIPFCSKKSKKKNRKRRTIKPENDIRNFTKWKAPEKEDFLIIHLPPKTER